MRCDIGMGGAIRTVWSYHIAMRCRLTGSQVGQRACHTQGGDG